MNLSKTASYSLNVLSYMATHEESILSATALHDLLLIPYPYLRQVLSSLSKKGFIRSTRGRHGGFVFRIPKERIFLADVIESAEGSDFLNRCILGFTECPFNNQCALHSMWADARENMIKVLKQTSLADIAKVRL
jgi:Rrf2 family protein